MNFYEDVGVIKTNVIETLPSSKEIFNRLWKKRLNGCSSSKNELDNDYFVMYLIIIMQKSVKGKKNRSQRASERNVGKRQRKKTRISLIFLLHKLV